MGVPALSPPFFLSHRNFNCVFPFSSQSYPTAKFVIDSKGKMSTLRHASKGGRAPKPTHGENQWCSGLCGALFYLTVTAVNVLVLVHYMHGRSKMAIESPQSSPQQPSQIISKMGVEPTVIHQQPIVPPIVDRITTATTTTTTATTKRNTPPFIPSTAACKEGDIWCCHQGKMPVASHFGFGVATDTQKWYESCQLAASGQQILLPRIMKEITHPYDFIDGDVSFQFLHKQVDEFLTVKDGFTGRMKPGSYDASKAAAPAPNSYGQFYGKVQYTKYEHMHRTPILMSGFMRYSGYSKDFLRGRFLGFEGVGLKDILRLWDKQKDSISMDERFMLVTNLNENWGFLSSSFPGRTSAWGRVDFEKYPALKSFLDDPRLLLLAIGQHSNISHPKVLMLPRGLPDTAGFSNHAGW